jgi:hypothetical protein
MCVIDLLGSLLRLAKDDYIVCERKLARKDKLSPQEHVEHGSAKYCLFGKNGWLERYDGLIDAGYIRRLIKEEVDGRFKRHGKRVIDHSGPAIRIDK